jgi:DNA ligase (NAD+)
LENTYNAQDLLDREERIKRIIDKASEAQIHNSQLQIPYTIEPKFDGISVELIYKEGKLHQAITRGDGLVGEDITINAKTIKNIPQQLK